MKLAQISRLSTFSSPCLRASVVGLLLGGTLLLTACDERRKSNEELGLNAQQAAGRRVYDDYCDRCHEPYSSRGKKGPPLKGLYKHQYMSLSGLPANDDRVGDIIIHGRSQMPAYGQALNDKQIQDLIAYLHTL
jgi:mono/diheme cytochrome c family protein